MLQTAYIQDCLRRKVIFFTGKGGVGKSTLAWATALACKQQGLRVRVASWSSLGPEGKPFPDSSGGIEWLALETMSAFREYVLRLLRFETVFDAVFDNFVLKTFILAAPGVSETVIAGKIWDMAENNEQDLLIVDLPSSGHALSFFSSPIGVVKIFTSGFVHKEAEKICEFWTSDKARIDLVALPEELPIVEAGQLKNQLEALAPFHFGYLHMNGCLPRYPNVETLSPQFLPELGSEACTVVQKYRTRLARQEEAVRLSADLKLSTVRVPRFPTESLEATLRSVASYLEAPVNFHAFGGTFF